MRGYQPKPPTNRGSKSVPGRQLPGHAGPSVKKVWVQKLVNDGDVVPLNPRDYMPGAAHADLMKRLNQAADIKNQELRNAQIDSISKEEDVQEAGMWVRRWREWFRRKKQGKRGG